MAGRGRANVGIELSVAAAQSARQIEILNRRVPS